ncbi:tRNA 2-thiocytidine(32) synthetase TtcA [bacterium]|nr:tRNA 2-thiocytidine(32) synthetase TtcA [bacterium]
MTRTETKIRSLTAKAVLEYNMIEHGDRVLLGVSGGPDSLALLELFRNGFADIKRDFKILAVHVDLGFDQPPPANAEFLESHFRSAGVDYRIVRTEIAERALDPAAKKNPCFICSLYRRRAIYEAAREEGCNKIAYGHHRDDIIETLLLNILYGRVIGAMNPVQELFHGSLFVIRPFLYVNEWLLKKFAEEKRLPRLPRLCPVDGETRRETVKKMIAGVQKNEPDLDIRNNIFRALRRSQAGFSRSPLKK